VFTANNSIQRRIRTGNQREKEGFFEKGAPVVDWIMKIY